MASTTPPSFKFIIIGESGTGKTSIVSRLVRKRFNPSTSQTIGADYFDYQITVDNKIVQLVIWDTAGQERFYTLVKSYYRLAIGILVVFDITNRQSYDSVPRWLRDARQEADPNCQVLLVGNKSDLFSDRAVSTEEAKHFATQNQVNYIETSALADENIEIAFINLTTDIYKKTVTGQITSNAQIKKTPTESEPEEKVNPCC